MKENQVSQAALITSYFRDYYAIHKIPMIFDDFYTANFTKPDSLRNTINGFLFV